MLWKRSHAPRPRWRSKTKSWSHRPPSRNRKRRRRQRRPYDDARTRLPALRRIEAHLLRYLKKKKGGGRRRFRNRYVDSCKEYEAFSIRKQTEEQTAKTDKTMIVFLLIGHLPNDSAAEKENSSMANSTRGRFCQQKD